MGNPHAIFWVADVAAIPLEAVGPQFETLPMFPEKANISFAEVLAPDRIKLRVWERGVGITLGCGSAACATLVAASRLGLTGRAARIDLPGGALTIEWRASDDHVLMTGRSSSSGRSRSTRKCSRRRRRDAGLWRQTEG